MSKKAVERPLNDYVAEVAERTEVRRGVPLPCSRGGVGSAGTSVKNPAYPDVLYLDNLIGTDTVSTVPQKKLDAFIYHGAVRDSLEDELDITQREMDTLRELGVNIEAVARELELEGVKKFAVSYAAALAILRKKRQDPALAP